MATPNNEDSLKFEVAVDIRNSLKAMEKFQRAMKKSMKAIADGSAKAATQSVETAKVGKKATKGWTKSVDQLNQAYERQDAILKQRGEALREAQENASKGTKEEREGLQEYIKKLKEVYKQQLGIARVAKTTRDKGDLLSRVFAPGMKKMQRQGVLDEHGVIGVQRKQLNAAGKALAEPLESFLDRDLKGLMEQAAKRFGAVLKRSFHGGRLLTRLASTSLKRRGERLQIRGKAAGGAGGAVQQLGGLGLKGIGGLINGIGKFMRLIEPLATLLSGSIVALIKLFLDADAMVKEFNKSIMDSASNLEFLKSAGGSAKVALANMGDALDGVREAAMDPSFNNALGITKDTHSAILNTLTQEGVSFGKLSAQAGDTAAGMKDMMQGIVKVGVAYSLGLGVPLQEIMTLQAEMQVEMGQSLDETRRSFAMMTTAAEESGLAANKFFNTIRGLSTDLGLFNLRMEDSVSLLSKISKVMSPRNAAKFMQEAVQGMKSMGRQEKMRLGMFAGKANVKAIVDRDIKRKTDALIESIATKTKEKPDVVRKDFMDKGFAGIESRLEAIGDSSLTDSAMELSMQKTQASKGEYGMQMATADLGVGGAIELKRDALLTDLNDQSKKSYKSIREALGDLDFEAIAESHGFSDETIKAMGKMEVAIEKQRRVLLDGAMSEAETQAINEMGYDELIDKMSDAERLAAGANTKTIEEKMLTLAQGQAEKTQSFQQKLENLVDWFMNEFYKVIMGIWETILDLNPFVSDSRKYQKEQLAAMRNDLRLNKEIAALSAAMAATSKDDPAYKVLEEQLRIKKELKSGNAAFLAGERGPVGTRINTDRDAIGNALKPLQAGDPALDVARPVAVKDLGRRSQPAAAAGEGLGLLSVGGVKVPAPVNGVGAPAPAPVVAPAGQLASPVAPVVAPAGQLGSPVAPVAPPAIIEAAEATNEHLTAIVQSNKSTQDTLSGQGTKIAPVTLKEEAKGMEAAMLSALRLALFEYYLYSGTDRGTLLATMKAGGVNDPRRMAEGVAEKSVEAGSIVPALKMLGTKPAELPARALGGMVTGIANGLAVVAAHGEGLASVGRGERIAPAGGRGGGGGVNIAVNGIGGHDLAQLIEGKVVEGIREFKRREKFY